MESAFARGPPTPTCPYSKPEESNQKILLFKIHIYKNKLRLHPCNKNRGFVLSVPGN